MGHGAWGMGHGAWGVCGDKRTMGITPNFLVNSQQPNSQCPMPNAQYIYFFLSLEICHLKIDVID
ncbi:MULTISPECIES: hypothetical protein [Nostoc]|uniref:Uncharacterized protein n=1 Tax=Nostoc paludosum FACHB-159 TaxID=2692908 RepID=A0ABR8KBR8_9NOSO|nr:MULTISPECIES: hypothetical protein [Nostoc]MBD2736986.1 hypothetical protein [Nostoc paludosum FACHB-159]